MPVRRARLLKYPSRCPYIDEISNDQKSVAHPTYSVRCVHRTNHLALCRLVLTMQLARISTRKFCIPLLVRQVPAHSFSLISLAISSSAILLKGNLWLDTGYIGSSASVPLPPTLRFTLVTPPILHSLSVPRASCSIPLTVFSPREPSPSTKSHVVRKILTNWYDMREFIPRINNHASSSSTS
ncbi:uncharacterized protein BDR25DRAFT_363190 [Lindgomyces ingoldianus]|uniref:Uncharacterized protein n=1 Tax=Lindgomyces ingoldianus TaxID=673940 RepID=A0ACB6QAE6_9PLEO|nr:uncharacterized protein BDR25DRAFT_363190 [Lindgomyces ingoldianus]KAF2463116.1 hypothetical protein BDR25DRAFT_363190 [Lindgomyces ingoldianus]